MIEKLTINPANIVNSDKGTLKKNKVADITIYDPKEEYLIDKNNFYSKGKNTPFQDWKVRGKVKYTIVSGKVVYKN